MVGEEMGSQPEFLTILLLKAAQSSNTNEKLA